LLEEDPSYNSRWRDTDLRLPQSVCVLSPPFEPVPMGAAVAVGADAGPSWSVDDNLAGGVPHSAVSVALRDPVLGNYVFHVSGDVGNQDITLELDEAAGLFTLKGLLGIGDGQHLYEVIYNPNATSCITTTSAPGPSAASISASEVRLRTRHPCSPSTYASTLPTKAGSTVTIPSTRWR
jgi:hypothetical protein